MCAYAVMYPSSSTGESSRPHSGVLFYAPIPKPRKVMEKCKEKGKFVLWIIKPVIVILCLSLFFLQVPY